MNNSEIKIYKAEDGKTEIQVKLDHDTVWLTQRQMGELFDKDSDTIGLHLKNIFESEELHEHSTTEYSSVVRQEGKREVTRKIKIYNLDAIISVGYRVNSKRGTQFRIWASSIIKDYLIKGYSINEQRLRHQNEQLRELQESVKMLENVLKYRDLSGDMEINGLQTMH